jgi:hypothetical protein
MPSSGMWRRVGIVSEKRVASIFRLKRIRELSKLAVTYLLVTAKIK